MASIVPWRQMLLDSLEANKHLMQSKYFQLATVKRSGGPAVRTVVFRGFEEGSNKLLITTDARSRKIEELKALPLGELLVYFTDTWEQFRVSGHLDLIGPESSPEEQMIRKRIWDQTSSKTLIPMVGPHPGLPVSDNEPEPPPLDKDAGPVDNFLILTLEPAEVDYLHLKEGKKLYFEKNASSEWTSQALNP